MNERRKGWGQGHTTGSEGVASQPHAITPFCVILVSKSAITTAAATTISASVLIKLAATTISAAGYLTSATMFAKGLCRGTAPGASYLMQSSNAIAQQHLLSCIYIISRLCIRSQLPLKTSIHTRHRPYSADDGHGLVEPPAATRHQIGSHEGGTARSTSKAMNQHTTRLDPSLDENVRSGNARQYVCVLPEMKDQRSANSDRCVCKGNERMCVYVGQIRHSLVS